MKKFSMLKVAGLDLHVYDWYKVMIFSEEHEKKNSKYALLRWDYTKIKIVDEKIQVNMVCETCRPLSQYWCERGDEIGKVLVHKKEKALLVGVDMDEEWQVKDL